MRIMAMFKKGYEVNRQEKERQERNRENLNKKLFRFFLSEDGAEADLVFLTEEPVNFHEHTVKVSRNGKDSYDSFTCTQDDHCELCNDGDRPSFKGAFLVFDKREFTSKDKDGKKRTIKGSLKLFVYGTRVVSQLDRLSSRYGLAGREITMVRLGSGTSTTYTFERGDKVPLTEKDIRAMLPEKLRDSYDGTEDSLYAIIEEQLMMCVKNYQSPDTESSEDDDDDAPFDGGNKVINVDADDEEVAETASRKKKLSSSSGKKSLFKNRAENSVRGKAKSLLRSKE